MLQTVLTLPELLNLTQSRQNPSISIFMPTHRAGDGTKQDPLKFKNLWNQVEQKLSSRGLRRPDIEKISTAVNRFAEDSMFWSYQSDGLALFAGPQSLKIFQLPFSVEEVVFVGSRFHIKPLLPLFMMDQRFFLLGVSLQKPRVFEGSPFGIDELTPEGLPSGMREILEGLEMQKSLQVRSVGVAPRQGQSSVYHGHDPADMDKVRVEAYLRKMSNGINQLLNGERAPLILVGVEYLQSMYRQLSDYQNLLPAGINKNPELLKNHEIQELAASIIEPYFEQQRQSIVNRYNAQKQSGMVSSDLESIVLAAHHGRIDTCMIGRNKHCWGSYDSQNETVRIDEFDGESEDGEDLLDLICLETLKNGGTAYALDENQMPDRQVVAALMRY